MSYESRPAYSEAVLRRFRAPAHAGGPESGSVTVHSGRRETGCAVQLSARIAQGRIAGLRYRIYGCPHAVAALELAAERLEGRPPETLARLRGLELQAPLDVPAEKLGVLLVIEDGLRALAGALGVALER